MKKNMVWLVLGMVMLAGAPLLFAASSKKGLSVSPSASSRTLRIPAAGTVKQPLLSDINQQLFRDQHFQANNNLSFVANRAKEANALAEQTARKFEKKQFQLEASKAEAKAAKASLDKAKQTVEKQGASVTKKATSELQAAQARYDSAVVDVGRFTTKIETLKQRTTEVGKALNYWDARIKEVKGSLEMNPEYRLKTKSALKQDREAAEAKQKKARVLTSLR